MLVGLEGLWHHWKQQRPTFLLPSMPHFLSYSPSWMLLPRKSQSGPFISMNHSSPPGESGKDLVGSQEGTVDDNNLMVGSRF